MFYQGLFLIALGYALLNNNPISFGVFENESCLWISIEVKDKPYSLIINFFEANQFLIQAFTNTSNSVFHWYINELEEVVLTNQPFAI